MKHQILLVSIPLLLFHCVQIHSKDYGDPCIPPDDCATGDCCDILKFLKCMPDLGSNICKCHPDLALLNPDVPETCVKFPEELGASCDRFIDDDFCRQIPNSECHAETLVCACTSDYFQVGTNQCIKYAENLNDPCPYPQQCDQIDGAVCSSLNPAIGVCICNVETHMQHPTDLLCLPFCQKMNDTCTLHPTLNQCVKVGDGVDVICVEGEVSGEGACGCNSPLDYFLHPDGNSCLTFSDSLGDPCVPESRQCEDIAGSECITEICQCDSLHATHPNGEECRPLRNQLGEECVPDTTPEQCSLISGGVCHGGNETCICDPVDYFEDEMACNTLPTLPLDPCLTPEHCATVEHTICDDKQCHCDSLNGYTLSPDHQSCIILADQVNSPCSNDDSCRNVPFTHCDNFNNTCTCDPAYVPKGDLTSCIPVVWKIGGSCEQPSQCLWGIGDNSFCIVKESVGTCECIPLHIAHEVDGGNDRCLLIAPVSGPCEEDVQCKPNMGNEAICPIRIDKRVCSCSDQSEFYMGRCALRRGLHASCALDEECIVGTNEHAFCDTSTKTCQCQPGKVEENLSCYSRPKLNEGCKYSFECTASIQGSVSCVDGKCACGAGITPTSEYVCGGAARATLHSLGFHFIIFSLGILVSRIS